MKRPSLLLICAVALCVNACEQHPLPGEPRAPGHPQPATTSEAPAPTESRDTGAQPAAQPTGAPSPQPQPGDAKFFPEKK